MSGTISTPYSLMSTQIVDNTTGLVKASNIRNIIESLAGIATSTQTASYTITAQDRGTIIRSTAPSPITITVPAGVLLPGQGFGVRQVGNGVVTIAGSGVTLKSSTGSFVTTGINALLWVTADVTTNTLYVDTNVALA